MCATPNRLSGPHDVSCAFDAVATGFHLKEYTTGELVRLFRAVGFGHVEAYALIRGRTLAVPLGIVRATEGLLAILPRAWRRRLGNARPLVWLLGIQISAVKT